MDKIGASFERLRAARNDRGDAPAPRQPDEKAAAASTVEALMFDLRRGTKALKERPVLARVSVLSEPQMHAVCARLLKLRPDIARPWTNQDVERLVEAWVRRHG